MLSNKESDDACNSTNIYHIRKYLEMPVAAVETWPPTLEDSKALPAWPVFRPTKLNSNLTSR